MARIRDWERRPPATNVGNEPSLAKPLSIGALCGIIIPHRANRNEDGAASVPRTRSEATRDVATYSFLPIADNISEDLETSASQCRSALPRQSAEPAADYHDARLIVTRLRRE